METTSVDWRVLLGTRTYFYNLAQSRCKDLLLIDFTGKLTLAEVGLKVVTPGPKFFEGLVLPTDAFDVEQVTKFLEDKDCKDVDALAKSLTQKAQADAYAMKKRLFTFIMSNNCVIGEVILSEIFEIYQTSPVLRMMANSYELEIRKVIESYPRLIEKIKEVLGHEMDEPSLKKEINYFLIGVRLCHSLSLQNEETFILKRGHSDLLQKYPFLDKGNNSKHFFDLQRGQALPNEIFFDHLYLGNGKHVIIVLPRPLTGT